MASSSNSTSTRPPLWYCHECNLECQPLLLPDPHCSHCHSTFVEELVPDDEDDRTRLNSQNSTHHSSHNPLPDLAAYPSPPIPSTRQRYEQTQQQAGRQPNLPAGFNSREPTRPSSHSPLPDLTAYPSPPIPSTRQRYEQTQQQADPQPNLPDMLGPLLNIFGLQQYLRPQNPNSHRTEPGESRARDHHNRSSSPDLPSNLPPLEEFGSQARSSEPSDSLPRTASRDANEPSPPNVHRPFGGTWTASLNNPADGEAPSNHMFYTMTFDADDNTGTTNQQDRPSILNFFSVLQQAVGQATQRQTQPSGPDHRPAAQRQDAPDEPAGIPHFVDDFARHQPSDEAGHDSDQQPRWADDGSHLHTGPSPDPTAVNVEEEHPLRQFVSMLNSLMPPQDGTEREIPGGMNGFVFNAGPGASRFEFAGNFGLPVGQFGDYVFNEMGMQDVVSQLMNMAGVNNGHNPIPASEAKIKSLKQFKIDSKRLEEGEDECAICKDVFALEDECMELPCHHVFHAEGCITPWLKQNGTCPVCRYSLVNDPSDDPEDVPLDSSMDSSTSATESTHIFPGSFDTTHHHSLSTPTSFASDEHPEIAHSRSMAELAAGAAERRARHSNTDDDEFLMEPGMDVD